MPTISMESHHLALLVSVKQETSCRLVTLVLTITITGLFKPMVQVQLMFFLLTQLILLMVLVSLFLNRDQVSPSTMSVSAQPIVPVLV